MAIQFKCPGCGAMIRVPDTSAGKRGTCPQCSEKLIVPIVPQGTTAAVAAQSPTPVAASGSEKLELPHIGTPHIDVAGKASATKGTNAAPVTSEKVVLPGLDPLAGPSLPKLGMNPQTPPNPAIPSLGLGLPPFDADVTSGLGLPPIARERKKKQQNSMGWLIPVICVVVLLGVVGWIFWDTQPRLEGKLVANSISGFETPPALIPGSLSGLTPSDLGLVQKRLAATPATWNSNTSRLTFTGSEKGIEVVLHPGRGYHFVSVQTAQNKAFVDYIKLHGEAFEKSRLASIKKHAPAFFESWKNLFVTKTAQTDQAPHRDNLIYPSLVTGIGHHLEALTEKAKYPCVYEDSESRIYFLLPNATKTFTLHGRKVADGSAVPVNFTVHVEGSMEAAPASPTKKKAKPKTKEERESENEGMNPELREQKDAGNPDSEADALQGGLGNLLAPGSRPSNTTTTKNKSPRKMKLEMMDDEEMPDDAMPGKPKTKSSMKSKTQMMDDEMMDDEMMDGDMMEKPKPKTKK